MTTQTTTTTSAALHTHLGDLKLRNAAVAGPRQAQATPATGSGADVAAEQLRAFPGLGFKLTPTEERLRAKRNWGFLESAYDNSKVMGLTTHFVTITMAILFNKSSLAKPAYDWLNTYDRFTIHTVHTWILLSSCQLLLVGLFALTDLSGRPSWLARYRMQPHKPPTVAQYKKLMPVVLFNLVVVNTISNLIYYPLAEWRGIETTYESLPSGKKLVGQWLVCLLMEDIGFYAVHRALHHPKIYKYIHKKHHEFSAPIAGASTYAHPLEHYFSNLLPILVGLLITRAHLSVQYLFFSGLMIGTHAQHSGYNSESTCHAFSPDARCASSRRLTKALFFPAAAVPFLTCALVHDWHHYFNTENYGPVGLLDAIFKTNKTFKAWTSETVAAFEGDRAQARQAALEKLAQIEAEEEERAG
ncbi:sterol desaturase [Pseudozyma hubeiensis SY62]|uniref:Sterol desaturase n=1 Tax=Pseudozyma hubeiensis (strain SY62) TaxID=1305764 RepID=R9NW70_PSEHS|nr:sterol desaturase [Pseudozyma hubeiensis SY62]GAC92749.1 sterol desaturase [Pseudozyma hubeiensis SY62]